jgi:non-canonical purine NTP pyrophosphatase (RdgB/HAM1 family)
VVQYLAFGCSAAAFATLALGRLINNSSRAKASDHRPGGSGLSYALWQASHLFAWQLWISSVYNIGMQNITFITGNQPKADYLARYLGFPVKHQKLDLEEIQSLDLKEVVEHKVRQAYEFIKTPVIVEDVALEFKALGRLPGTFIRFYVDEVPFETICRTLDGLDRAATARCVFGYYDGKQLELFEGFMNGSIAEHPAGENGYGWDRLFIPERYNITRAEMNEEDDRKTYTTIKPFAKLKTFLETKR